VIVHRWSFCDEGSIATEYLDRVSPLIYLSSLMGKADVFSFPERSFLSNSPAYNFPSKVEVLGILRLTTSKDWFEQIGKTARYAVRKAGRLGLTVRERERGEEDIDQVYSILHETPIRQGSRFAAYNYSYEDIRAGLTNPDPPLITLVAYHGNQLVGIMSVRIGEQGARIQSINSSITLRSRMPISNALIAYAVDTLCKRDIKYLIYGHMGYVPSLDSFKRHNGFLPVMDRRYFVPLTRRGAAALRLGLCKELWDVFPRRIWPSIYSLGLRVGRIAEFHPSPEDQFLHPKNGSV